MPPAHGPWRIGGREGADDNPVESAAGDPIEAGPTKPVAFPRHPVPSMNCLLCQKVPVAVRFTHIPEQGKVTELGLCRSCVEREGALAPGFSVAALVARQAAGAGTQEGPGEPPVLCQFSRFRRPRPSRQPRRRRRPAGSDRSHRPSPAGTRVRTGNSREPGARRGAVRASGPRVGAAGGRGGHGGIPTPRGAPGRTAIGGREVVSGRPRIEAGGGRCPVSSLARARGGGGGRGGAGVEARLCRHGASVARLVAGRSRGMW